MTLLARILAWVYLIASVVFAVFILVNYSTIEEPYLSGNFSRSVPNPIGVGAGIGVLFQGLIIYCLVMLTARIAENTAKLCIEVSKSKEMIIETREITPNQDGVSDIPIGQLHQAVWQGDYILAKRLISLGADIHAQRHLDGKTPMDLAVERGDQLIIKLLS